MMKKLFCLIVTALLCLGASGCDLTSGGDPEATAREFIRTANREQLVELSTDLELREREYGSLSIESEEASQTQADSNEKVLKAIEALRKEQSDQFEFASNAFTLLSSELAEVRESIDRRALVIPPIEDPNDPVPSPAGSESGLAHPTDTPYSLTAGRKTHLFRFAGGRWYLEVTSFAPMWAHQFSVSANEDLAEGWAFVPVGDTLVEIRPE